MKKTKVGKVVYGIIGFVLIFTILFTLYSSNNVVAFADMINDNYVSNEVSEKEMNEINEYETIINSFIEPIFGNIKISSCQYLYNLDDSADYVYVEFKNGGYVIYAKQTMEMLEYSLHGSLPYKDLNASKYYAGPENYFYKKENNRFLNITTGEQIDILETETNIIANNIRSSIINETVSEYADIIDDEIISIDKNDFLTNEYSAPELDSDNLIAASSTAGYLIPNYRYFLLTPTIGDNYVGESYGNGNSGTCGPVAAQILLSYNNYYNNRKIIEDRFLNGYNDDSDTVTIKEKNPNYCIDPMSMTEWTLGTRSEDSGKNSFYSEIISRIMKPNTSGSTNKEVKNGIASYLNSRLSTSEYSVNYKEKGWFFGYSPIDSSIIKKELDTGRPIIISMDSNLGGSNHFVIGYGYQNYTYADGSGTYEGYVVHYGWQGSSRACVWINSAWCDGYVSLKINHTHSYRTVGTIPGTNRTEYKCKTCGHRTDAGINMLAGNRYVECVASIPQNGYKYKDFYMTFETSGNKLFQTFGSNDVVMFLYDSENNLLKRDDDGGYKSNSMFNYTIEANKPYILRVKFYNNSNNGEVKVGITPASVVYSNYEDINTSNAYNVVFSFTTSLNTTCILTYTPPKSGVYEFKTGYYGDTLIDTCLYVIDPYVTSKCYYNDDGAEDLQAKLSIDLIEGRTYFIVVSTYDIVSTKGNLGLSIFSS